MAYETSGPNDKRLNKFIYVYEIEIMTRSGYCTVVFNARFSLQFCVGKRFLRPFVLEVKKELFHETSYMIYDVKKGSFELQYNG